ncbi:lactonase family protein [Ochrobactrum soli]|uniref:Lactonase family protein n=1 Tax=Ochrobactrum soli TaxID=2448455 RepID=A0A849KYC8_9HYPH|nr:lactonase family protein [[Ochrobactrum] soli]NNU62846.1 lactonase family protein [[Ochrobactrum] soli]
MERHINGPLRLIIGAYTHSLPHVQARGVGISFLDFDPETGEFSAVADHTDIRNPTYLALSGDKRRLYAVEELAEKDGADIIVFEREATTLTAVARVPAHGDWPCHVSLDKTERRLFISNYLNGTFVTYALDDDGRPQPGELTIQRTGTGANPERQEGPHVHQGVATPDGRYVMLCDAGTDEIARHALSGSLIDPEPDIVIKTDGGSLPRHLAFAPDGKRFFVVHELGCSVRSYAYGPDDIQFLTKASTLPQGWSGDSNCATIRAHPNGKFVYASNRAHDSIVVFDVSGPADTLLPTSWHSTRGQIPRDFNIDPTGRFLIAANQDGHSLSALSIDAETGALTPLGEHYAIGSPVCVLFG